MHSDLTTLFTRLWQSYKAVTPSAERIHQILAAREPQPIVNDHIALRTFNLDPVGLDVLARHFISLGYRQGGEYHFESKKLYARHYQHPDANVPKVFISELLVDQCSPALQAIITRLVAQVDPGSVTADNFLYSGRHWALDYATYQQLLAESEYAAWTAAWGYRANHFTVSINHLEKIQTVPQMNQLLKDQGFKINTAGGEVKGSPEDLLEQSSTLADRVDLAFSDQVTAVPSCFYEFARRYPGPDGQLYSGFVAASADKIFESTNVKDVPPP